MNKPKAFRKAAMTGVVVATFVAGRASTRWPMDVGASADVTQPSEVVASQTVEVEFPDPAEIGMVADQQPDDKLKPNADTPTNQACWVQHQRALPVQLNDTVYRGDTISTTNRKAVFMFSNRTTAEQARNEKNFKYFYGKDPQKAMTAYAFYGRTNYVQVKLDENSAVEIRDLDEKAVRLLRGRAWIREIRRVCRPPADYNAPVKGTFRTVIEPWSEAIRADSKAVSR